MATFEKREGGWRVKIRLKGISESKSFRIKAEAAAWAAQREAEINATGRGAIPNKTVKNLIERYIDEVIPTKVSPKADLLRLRRLAGMGEDGKREPDDLALVRLDVLGGEHIEAWRDRRLKKVSSSSVRREWNSLAGMFNHAVKVWKWLHVNPCHGVEKPADSVPRTGMYSDGQVEAIVISSGYSRDQVPFTKTAKVGAAFLFALETAMRLSEITRLTPDRVFLDRRVVVLDEIDERKPGRFRTKTGTSREVPLSTEAVRILAQLLPAVPDGDTVFGVTSEIMEALFRKVRIRAGIEGLTFHDTRRTALTRLAKKVDVMTLAKISGHKNLKILLETYYKPDMSEVAALLD